MVTGWYKAPPEETTSFCVPCHGGTFCSGGTQSAPMERGRMGHVLGKGRQPCLVSEGLMRF